jgi:hypothetical protein
MEIYSDNPETEINAILLKNRNILKLLFDAGKIKILKIELVELGFNFSCHTSRMKNQDTEQDFQFVYNYGIGKLDEENFEIIRVQF